MVSWRRSASGDGGATGAGKIGVRGASEVPGGAAGWRAGGVVRGDMFVPQSADKGKQEVAWMALAETTTGGSIAVRLVRLARSSAYFDRRLVAYSKEAKRQAILPMLPAASAS